MKEKRKIMPNILEDTRFARRFIDYILGPFCPEQICSCRRLYLKKNSTPICNLFNERYKTCDIKMRFH